MYSKKYSHLKMLSHYLHASFPEIIITYHAFVFLYRNSNKGTGTQNF